MLRFLLSRLLQSAVVLFLVYSITFWMLMAVPGDPFLGEKNPPESVRLALADKYGLDYLALSAEQRQAMGRLERLGAQFKAYGSYLSRTVLRGDLGPSIQYEAWDVRTIILSALPVSVSLGALALVIALWGGVLGGMAGAVWKGQWPDMALTVFSLFGVSLPTFVIGTLLQAAFAIYWGLLPAVGWGGLSQMVLPAFTLALFFMAYISRLTRVSVLDTLSQDYVRTARAKGLPPSRVVTSHVLRNAGLPVLSYLGPAAAMALTGSFVVEKVFAIPGLGTHFVNACINVDIPLVLGTVLTFTAIVVFFNLLVDVAYAAVDPRITL